MEHRSEAGSKAKREIWLRSLVGSNPDEAEKFGTLPNHQLNPLKSLSSRLTKGRT